MKLDYKLSLFESFLEIPVSNSLANLRDKVMHVSKCEEDVAIKSPIIGGNCFFGAYTYMNNGGYIRSNVFIGRFCSIGRRVTIAAGGHSYLGISTHPKLMLKVKSTELTIIESDVWIGDGAIVMPGVKIGQGSVVGANAVVTRSIPPYSIAVGQPARVIKKRFSDRKIILLCSSDIFEREVNSIKKLNKIIELPDDIFIIEFNEWLRSSERSLKLYESFLLKS